MLRAKSKGQWDEIMSMENGKRKSGYVEKKLRHTNECIVLYGKFKKKKDHNKIIYRRLI